MKNICIFYLKFCQFLVVKFSIYLNRRVFVMLLAYTSHILRPLDLSCVGPFEQIFNQMAHKFTQENCDQSIGIIFVPLHALHM